MRGGVKLLVAALAPAIASAAMPVDQQNALVRKYCGVCHSDAAGRAHVAGFDASHADPSVAAMLLSKLTNGLPLKFVSAAKTDPSAAAAIDNEMKNSAIHAAGVPAPDAATSRAWVMALSGEAEGAAEWTVTRAGNATIASIVREVPAVDQAGRADIYRLRVACSAGSHTGNLQLAWAPGGPKVGQEITAAVDGGASRIYKNEKHETGKMASNSGPGDILLTGLALPAQSLTVGNLVSAETVTFPFASVDSGVRDALSPCFAGGGLSTTSGSR